MMQYFLQNMFGNLISYHPQVKRCEGT